MFGCVDKLWAFSFKQIASLLSGKPNDTNKQTETQAYVKDHKQKQAKYESNQSFLCNSQKDIIQKMCRANIKLQKTQISDKIQQKISEQKQKDPQKERKQYQKLFIVKICQFLDLLQRATNTKNHEQLIAKLNLINEKLTQNEMAMDGKLLLHRFLQRKFIMGTKIFETVIEVIPCPLKNQIHKVRSIYNNSKNDKMYTDIQACNQNGTLMIYATNNIDLSKRYRSYSYILGRVYSGKYTYGLKMNAFQCKNGNEKIKRSSSYHCVTLAGIKIMRVGQIKAGNLVIINNLFLNKSAVLLTQSEYFQGNSFRNIQNLSINTIQINLSPKKPQQLPLLLQKLKITTKVLHQLQLQIQQTGQLTIKGKQRSDLQDYIVQIQKQIQLNKSQISTIYKQTITCESEQLVLVKTQNKHNRLFGVAAPLQKQIYNVFNIMNQKQENFDTIQTYNKFQLQYGWDKFKDGQIWSFGYQHKQNILVDCFSYTNASKMHINQIKDSVESAFNWSTKQGVLCQQKVSGVKYSLIDCQLVSDAIHRGGGQIIPSSRRMFYASTILAKPTLLQPINVCSVWVNKKDTFEFINDCKRYSANIEQNILLQKQYQSQFLNNYKQFIISVAAKDWHAQILQNIYQLSGLYTKWRQVEGLAYDQGSRANQIVKGIRIRKGLQQTLPDLANYRDKI